MDFLLDPITIMIVFIALSIIAGIAQTRKEKVFSNQRASVAKRLGLVPIDAEGEPLNNVIQEFSVNVRATTDTQVLEAFSGTYKDCDITFFELRENGVPGSHEKVHTVVVFIDPELKLPHFFLGPKGFLDRLEAATGNNGIVLGDAVFSKHYILNGSESLRIKRSFSSSIVSLLIAMEDIELEGKEGLLFAYYSHRSIEAQVLPKFLRDTHRIYREFLSAVRK